MLFTTQGLSMIRFIFSSLLLCSSTLRCVLASQLLLQLTDEVAVLQGRYPSPSVREAEGVPGVVAEDGGGRGGYFTDTFAPRKHSYSFFFLCKALPLSLFAARFPLIFSRKNPFQMCLLFTSFRVVQDMVLKKHHLLA